MQVLGMWHDRRWSGWAWWKSSALTVECNLAPKGSRRWNSPTKPTNIQRPGESLATQASKVGHKLPDYSTPELHEDDPPVLDHDKMRGHIWLRCGNRDEVRQIKVPFGDLVASTPRKSSLAIREMTRQRQAADPACYEELPIEFLRKPMVLVDQYWKGSSCYHGRSSKHHSKTWRHWAVRCWERQISW